ncbi:MAG: endo-1,4-beta-xylanase [Alkalibacterium sp.]|nr:endo-1,4-beta-xylanase [Alkalibacterium sp.]
MKLKKIKNKLLLLVMGMVLSAPLYANAEEALELMIGFEEEEMFFEPRGETEQLERTSEDAYTGDYSLLVTERSQPWNGPAVRIEEHVDVSTEYSFSVWVKLIEEATVELQLSTQIGDGDNASYQTIDTQSVSSDEWVELAGTYRYDAIVDDFVSIYIESPNSDSVSFKIDDFSMQSAGSSSNISIQTELTPLKDIYEDYFLIGNAVSLAELEGQRLELLRHHHNLVTAENAMKPEYAYNSSREFDFTDQDRLVNRIKEEGLELHGHVLVWHQQSPEWLHTEDGQLLSREEALDNMYTHIEETVRHYGDDVIAWEVVNEAMNDNPRDPEMWRAMLRRSDWFDAIGDDYLELAYLKTREVLDENGWEDVKLYYNDYNDDNQSKASAIYYMVKEINENYAEDNPGELLIDGIGMQGHYNSGTNVDFVRMSIERFRELGVEIGVTELDITTASTGELTEEEEKSQALLYAQLFSLYKEHADIISRVTFWGLNDSTSWRAERNPLIFDRDLLAKEAYYAVANPEEYLARNDGSEESEKRVGQAGYGTPQLGEEIDDIWSTAEELAIDRYQLAWQGANGTGRVLWDEENLYVMVNVDDASIDTSSEFPWEQDSVEVFLEESFEQSSTYEEGTGQYRVNAEGQETFGEMTDHTSIETVVTETPTGYTVQFAIPWVNHTPQEGGRIGFDLQINDAESGNRESVAVWNDLSGQGFQNPSVFGELELTRADDSSTESDFLDSENGEGTNSPLIILAGLIIGSAAAVILVIMKRNKK